MEEAREVYVELNEILTELEQILELAKDGNPERSQLDQANCLVQSALLISTLGTPLEETALDIITTYQDLEMEFVG